MLLHLFLAILSVHTCMAFSYHRESQMACVDPERDPRSLCAYHRSCDTSFLSLANAEEQFKTSGAIKNITCDEDLVFSFEYYYLEAERMCAYGMDYKDPERIYLHIPRASASTIWNLTSADDPNRALLHASVTRNRAMCKYLRSIGATRCEPPYARPDAFGAPVDEQNTADMFCSLMETVTVECGSQAVRCIINSSKDRYTCASTAPISDGVEPPLTMNCSDVARSLVGRMYTESIDPVAPNDIAACTVLGQMCTRNLGTVGHEYDAFVCREPYFGPWNTTLCDLLPTHSQVTVGCGGQHVSCYSPLGEEEAHHCRYQGGDLNLFCSIPANQSATTIQPIYDVSRSIEAAGCGANALLRAISAPSPPPRSFHAISVLAPQVSTIDISQLAAMQPLRAAAAMTIAKPSSSYSPRFTFPSSGTAPKFKAAIRIVPDQEEPRLMMARSFAPSLSSPTCSLLMVEKAEADGHACDYLLASCGSQLNCTTDSHPDPRMHKSRSSFCAETLPRSCLGFSGTPPKSIGVTPQLSESGTVYSLQCVKNTITQSFHDIRCTHVPEYLDGECHYKCSLRTLNTLNLVAYPVLASVLLSANTTQAEKCAHVRTVALTGTTEAISTATIVRGELVRQTEYATNSFVCSWPYAPQDNDICVLSMSNPTYTMDCGRLRMECTRDSNGYECISSDWDAQMSNGALANTAYARTAPNVPLEVVRADIVMRPIHERCVELRDLYATQFHCGSDFVSDAVHACNFPVSSNHSDLVSVEILCGSTRNVSVVCTAAGPEHAVCAPNQALPYLEMACPSVSMHWLYGLWEENGRASTILPSADVCMDLRRQCLSAGPGAVFDCDSRYLSAWPRSQFCDPRIIRRVERTLTCGRSPAHRIDCSSERSGAEFDWIRCNSTTSQLLQLDCSVSMSAFDQAIADAAYNDDEARADEWICDMLRQSCGSAISCDTSEDGYCPTRLDTALTCSLPGELCAGNFCQVDGTSDGACIFNPRWLNLTCASDIDVSCERQDTYTSVPWRSAVSYRCTHAYREGFFSDQRDLSLNTLVPRSDLDTKSSFQSCLLIGRRALAADTLECSRKYIATLERPFCELPSRAVDVGGVFTCNDLLVTCTHDTDINRVRCTSHVNSTIWVLGENRNSVDFPTPPGSRGCVLAPRNFYLNPAERCGVLYDVCTHTCMSATSGGGAFCDDFRPDQKQFECDDQAIVCVPLAVPGGASPTLNINDLDRYILDADVDRHRRKLHCTHPEVRDALYPNSLRLDCVVDRALFAYRPNVCNTLMSECVNTLGTVNCIEPYFSTDARPFCTETVRNIEETAGCDCGVWWSDSEGIQRIPEALYDVSCYRSVALSQKPDTQCSARQLAHPQGMTCERRGLVSMESYIESVYSQADFVHRASMLFATSPWQQYWCLWSVSKPVPVCATRPGMRLRLCTVECPNGLQRASVNGSTSHYCCADPSDCRLSTDLRNCVLERHDSETVSVSSAPWWPDSVCPPNVQSAQTVFPLSTAGMTRGRIMTHVQQRLTAYNDWRSYGFVIVQYSGNARGVYYLTRPPHFDESFLYEKDASWSHSDSRAERYPNHWTPQDRVDSEATLMVQAGSVFDVQVTTYWLERTRGFQCTDLRLDWVYYMGTNLAARARVQARVNSHLTRLGAPDAIKQALVFRDSGAALRNSRLHVEQREMMMPTETPPFYVNIFNGTAARFTGMPYGYGPVPPGTVSTCRYTEYSRANRTCLEEPPMTCTNWFDPESIVLSVACPHTTMGEVLALGMGSTATFSRFDEHYTEVTYYFLTEYRSGVRQTRIISAPKMVQINAPYLAIEFDAETRQDILSGMTTYRLAGTDSYSADLDIARQRLTSGETPISAMSETFVEHHHRSLEAVRRIVPLMGAGDNNNKLYRIVRFHNYAHFVELSSGTASPVLDTHLVGYLAVDDSLTSLRISNFWDLFGYFAWRDWVLEGMTRTRHLRRAAPNAMCTLNTPTFRSGDTIDSLCRVPLCPLPVQQYWDWDVRAMGSVSSMDFFPNPAEFEVRKQPRSVPCGNGKGYCAASLGVSPTQFDKWVGAESAGQCVCAAHFQVETGMQQTVVSTISGARSAPRSLQIRSCEVDMRRTCMDPRRGVTTSCNGRGQCVGTFNGGVQSAECQCGSFPRDTETNVACNMANPRTCETHENLKWVTRGFEEATVGETMCLIPKRGCRNTHDCKRIGGDKYVRGDCYGCELPRGSTQFMRSPGVCEQREVITNTSDPRYDWISSPDQWGCRCSPGRYGRWCQYVVLQGACFDTAIESQLVGSAETTSTMCVWNAHLGQFEVEHESNIPVELRTKELTRILCRGITCSGHGRCSHAGMDNDRAETYRASTDPSYDYTNTWPVSQAELSFTNALYTRLRNQVCTCDVGWTGPQCRTPTCIAGCGEYGKCIVPASALFDARLNTSCSCPRRYDGVVLATGPRCETRCDGRGTIVPDASRPGFYTCSCTGLWYNGIQSNAVCSHECLVGSIKTIRSVSGAERQLCMCTTATGTLVQCDDYTAISTITGVVTDLPKALLPSSPTNVTIPPEEEEPISSSSSSTGATIQPISSSTAGPEPPAHNSSSTGGGDDCDSSSTAEADSSDSGDGQRVCVWWTLVAAVIVMIYT